MRSHLAIRRALWIALIACAGCNPTWTKEGKPTDSSMPVPPGGAAPTQVGSGGSGTAAQPAKP